MGNSGSGQGIVDDSIPSPIVGGGPGRNKSKVLPDLTPALRLRQTDNGAILHNGGTISTRKQERQKQSFDNNHHIEIKRDFYGSEPDLRYQGRLANFNNDSPSKIRISRSRKKYKAPTVPNNNNNIPGDSSSPDSFQEWENSMNGQPSRRLRLFKTRAETRKKIAEHNLHSLNSYLPAAGTLQRSLSTPQFHAELLEAAEKLKPVREPPVGKTNESPSTSPVGGYQSLDSGRERFSYGRTYENTGPQYASPFPQGRNQKAKHEICNERDSPSQELWNNPPTKPQAPVKTFYFGMNENGEINESSALDKFAEKIHHLSQLPMDSNSSQCSAEIFEEIMSNENNGGISVQLRATLPRKQLDIPRFSPTTAWRLLSNIDSPAPSEEDDLVQFEHRLLAPPLPVHVPVQMDKSADSGISGDASPQHHDSIHNSQAAWTPQQDLEETSSDGGFPCQPISPDQCSTAKYSPRFTLSLPRDDRIKLYGNNDKGDEVGQSSIDNKKMRRSGSGVFGKVGLEKEENIVEQAPLLDSNWVLSRSVPNSLNYTNVSLSRWNDNPNIADVEEELTSSLIKQPSFSYLQTGGHIMYLPEYTKPREPCEPSDFQVMSHQTMSKSCEDLSRGISDEPASLNTSESLEPPKIKKGKKFTFQSTVRQIERKRLAEKLSKQVEHKEKERKSELEAMRKVEEEFQRKREREKADIRQQLRLYTISQNSKNNTSTDLPTTQVLSEFRQQQREYKEYRPQRRSLSEMESMLNNEPNTKRATVHPKIVCQIPKSTQVYVTPRISGQTGSANLDCTEQVVAQTPTSDNYRKNFAQGGLPNSLTSTESEISAGHSSRTRQKESRYAMEEEESIISLERPKISLGITETKTIIIAQEKKTPGIFRKDVEESFQFEQQDQQVPSNVPLLGVSALQPFVKGKTYKPISFNPSRNQVAQFAN
ncbi:uncharacterized protein LOC106664129 isoform X2 [Cimex lectularius]|uniref:Uncharacterized protein n=1 Tax=Cimex lectularius TaxID=79782 RepID=A0A8I6TEZ0_CIMLE|nr:uncharacterized protein LOC106664129 isoform X2 [Cimex lectularius]